MKIICDQCGETLLPLANFCSYCGAVAPPKTVIVSKAEDNSIKDPVFCPVCGEPAPNDAIYCARCGAYLYDLPEKSSFFCPACKEKNKTNAKVCISCRLSFTDWFSMRGAVAERLGYKGNITLKETMNDISYHFIWDKTISIGRHADNYIQIPAPWVSGYHCKLDLKNNLIIDLDSKNGTYVNRNSQPVNNFPIDQVYEFNIAGIFTFTVLKIANAFIFRLTAILNQTLCGRMANMHVLDEIRKHYYILLTGDTDIYIYKINGQIVQPFEHMEETYQIGISNHFFYFSDTSQNVSDRLILKKIKNIPVNWEIVTK